MTAQPVTVRTDSKSRAVLTGHPNSLYVVTEQTDGTLTLVPARVVTDAQREYDDSPALQGLLSEALVSPTRHYER